MQRRNLVFDSDEDVPPSGAGDQIQRGFKTAPEGCPVAVGRGGTSPTPAPPFNPGFSVGFHWDSSKKDCLQGVVRWCEMISGQARAGIDFMYLHGSSRESSAGWLEKERPSSFIAKE